MLDFGTLFACLHPLAPPASSSSSSSVLLPHSFSPPAPPAHYPWRQTSMAVKVTSASFPLQFATPISVISLGVLLVFVCRNSRSECAPDERASCSELPCSITGLADARRPVGGCWPWWHFPTGWREDSSVMLTSCQSYFLPDKNAKRDVFFFFLTLSLFFLIQ